jgi:hypothetical protein
MGVVETPTSDVTVFQVHYGKRTLKTYTQGERVLRIEVIVHHTRELRGGRSVEHFPQRVARRKDILESNRRSLAGTSLAAETPVPLDTFARMKLDSAS